MCCASMRFTLTICLQASLHDVVLQQLAYFVIVCVFTHGTHCTTAWLLYQFLGCITAGVGTVSLHIKLT